MTKPYSMDLRERVVSAVDAEGMSRHEAAARFWDRCQLRHQMDGALSENRERGAIQDWRLQAQDPSRRACVVAGGEMSGE